MMRNNNSYTASFCPCRLGTTARLRAVMLVCLLLMAAGRRIAAAPATVNARLDSATLLMGQTTKLHLQVDRDKDKRGYFPIFSDTDSRPYATLLGDTIELSKSYTTDTVALPGNLTRITYHVPVQVFDSGCYNIPGFQYVVGADTIISNPLTLKVVPVKASATDKISGLTDVVDPDKGSWLDDVPDWVLKYWWAIIVGLVALVVLWFVVRAWLKHRKQRPARKPEMPADVEALQALKKLKEQQLWQSGENERYFVELTAILRRYVSRRFGISAPEMTTAQFLEELGRQPELSGYNAEMSRLLELADFIKFAKGKSLPDENEEAFNIVMKFVSDTRLTPEELAVQKQGQAAERKAPAGSLKAKAGKPQVKYKRKEDKR